MAKDVIARLKADTTHWDSGMAKATRSLNNFQKQNMSTDAVLKMGIGTLTKFASVTAVAGAAVEGFRKYMASTEATADALAQAQRTMTTVTNEFFRSLNDGNFSSFISGLDDIISRAQNAYQALDELGSFATRYAPKNAVDLQQIDALMKQARAAKAKGDTAEAERLINEARQVAEQAKKTTLAYGEKEAKAGFSVMREKLGAPFRNASEKQLAWYADPANWEEINRNAKEYQRQLDRINDLTQKASLGTTDDQLQNMRFYGKGEAVERIRQARKELEQAQKEFDEIKGKGLRAQTYLNTRDDGEEGQEFINAHQQIYGRQRAQFAIDAIQARIDRQDAMTTGGTHTTPKATAETPVYEESSIAAQEQRVQELTKLWREASEAVRDQYKVQLDEATAKLDEMCGKTKVDTSPLGLMDTKLKELKDAQQRAASPEEWQKYQQQIDQVTQSIKAFKGEVEATPVAGSMAYLNEELKDARVALDSAVIGTNEYYEALQRVADVTREIGQAQKEQNAAMSQSMTFQEGYGSMVGTLNGLTGMVDSLTSAFSENGTAWQKVMALLNAGLTVMNAVTTTMQFMNLLTGISTAKKLAETTATVGNTAASVAAQGVKTAEAGTDVAMIAVNKELTASYLELAAAQYMAAHASIPFAGFGIGAGFTASAAALVKSMGAMAFAEGGFITSNSYMGDATPILANAGEYVMNQNELGAVAGMVQSATENSGGSAQPYVRGADIYLGFNNYLKSSGRGEIVTTKSR